MDDNPNSQSLGQLAIDAALNSRWNDALKLNKQIIKLDPQNIDALNRQGHIFMEMGRNNMAKKYYSEVLKIDPYNPIALKNLKIIKAFRGSSNHGSFQNQNGEINSALRLSPSLFLQEPGKTKIVNLLKVAEPQKLSKAYCGMEVKILFKNHKITVTDDENNYLGVLPDDISHHLSRLLRGGNRFSFFIKSVRVNGLSVLIREIHRSKRFKNQPSFLGNFTFIPSTDILTPIDDQSDSENEDQETDEDSVS